MLVLVPKQVKEEIRQVSINFPPKRKQRNPCPTCKNITCYEHCNNCGISIDIKKDEFGKYRCYLAGTDILHYCHGDKTKSGKFLDVNQKYSQDQGNFYRDNVVCQKDNLLLKDAKIRRYLKLTGYGYADSLKSLDNMMKAKSWEVYSFEY